MAFDIFLLIVGFGLIAKGGDVFVDSSVLIGRALNVPRFVIGGTLVSLATNAPEVAVATTASLAGDSGIALGDAVGSCICNIGLIAGTVAMISPIGADARDFTKRALWMAAAGGMVVLFSVDGTLSRPLGMVLMLMAAAYLSWDFVGVRRMRKRNRDESVRTEEEAALWRAVGTFALGALLIIFGARLLVMSAQTLAVALGVPTAIIGFSVVAFGTSIPELVTGVAAARKGVVDLALGTVVGSNVLNLFLVVGLAGTINPLTLDSVVQNYAFPWMGFFFGALIVLVRRNGSVGPRAGLGLLALYLVYVVGLTFFPG